LSGTLSLLHVDKFILIDNKYHFLKKKIHVHETLGYC
jgi:hypothetical protein